MSRAKLWRIVLLLLCVSYPNWKTSVDRGARPGYIGTWDFAAVYYQARCAVERKDPFDPKMVLQLFEAEGGGRTARGPHNGRLASVAITVANYLPTTYLILAPVSLLSWHVALMLWIGLVSGLVVMAAFWVWDLAGAAPGVAGWMSCWVVLNSIILLWFGNTAGIATPLCVIAACLLLRERYALAAVVALALSLSLKPQDAGFIWLYFLLAGGTGRKRALQTLAVTGLLGLMAAIWIVPASPHWMQEMHHDVAVTTVPGGVNDPGPSGATSRGFDPIVSLQASISVFRNDAKVYNPLSFLIGGGLILVWGLAVWRKRSTHEGALLALAAAAILTMLPVYHRVHDTKLLLLTIPACAILWAGGGARRWVALALTTAAIFVTSDIPLIIQWGTTIHIALPTATLGGKLTYLLMRPAPVVLLAAGYFYLWMYIGYKPLAAGAGAIEDAALKSAAGVSA